MHEFIFLVREAQPVLLPPMDFQATGPLTLTEIEQNYLSLREKPIPAARRDCVIREIKTRARAAGDPETLDPATVDLLPGEHWYLLDPPDRRILLMQAITTGASFACIQSAACS